jgi:hypothetical protein
LLGRHPARLLQATALGFRQLDQATQLEMPPSAVAMQSTGFPC